MKFFKPLPAKVRNMYRAKVYLDKEQSAINWKFGALGWYELQPCVIGDNPDPEHYNKYYILSRSPNAMADWNLPYSQTKYYIPDGYSNTIGRYLGFNDMYKNNIFDGDIVRSFTAGKENYFSQNPSSFVDYIVIDGKLVEYEELFDGIYETYWHPYEFSISTDYTMDDIQIIGNIFDGCRTDFVTDIIELYNKFETQNK